VAETIKSNLRMRYKVPYKTAKEKKLSEYYKSLLTREFSQDEYKIIASFFKSDCEKIIKENKLYKYKNR